MLTIIILTVAAVLILFLGFARQRGLILPVAMLALVASLVAMHYPEWTETSILTGMLHFDLTSFVLCILQFVFALCIIPFLHQFRQRGNEELGDITGLFLLALIGGMIMVSYQNFIMMFLGIEILSISMYVLAGADRRRITSNEAAIKYFIMGSFASAILLFGIGAIYASTGSLSFGNVLPGMDKFYQIGVLFVLSGLAFKIALVPFHFWAPDVYEGTPTIFTAIMSSIVKIAGFGALLQYLKLSSATLPEWVFWFLLLIALVTIVVGNIMAYNQTSVKRILAYSGIVQAGFILIAVLKITPQTEKILIYYLIAYGAASLITFLITHFVERQSGSDHLDSFGGLLKANPLLGILMIIALISLGGGPLTAGFMAKFLVLREAVGLGYLSLAFVALVAAVISVYYYFKIINAIASPSGDHSWSVSWRYNSVLLVLTLILILFGIAPSLVMMHI